VQSIVYVLDSPRGRLLVDINPLLRPRHYQCESVIMLFIVASELISSLQAGGSGVESLFRQIRVSVLFKSNEYQDYS
jgi:hypothetical protein